MNIPTDTRTMPIQDAISGVRSRAERKLLRVTFPDGTVVCYKNATTTFVEALRRIGVQNVASVNLELCHLPLFTKELYPRFKDYLKPLDEGWYVNTQSDTTQKYLQLVSVKNQLGLDINVEIGSNIQPSSVKGFIKTRERTDCLLVKFPDGSFVGGQSPKETYIETIKKVGFDILRYKEFVMLGKEIVTRFQKYPNQIEVERGLWLTIPNQTKEKIKVLEGMSNKLKLYLEVSTI